VAGRWCRTSLPIGEKPKISRWAGEMESGESEGHDVNTDDGTVGGDWFAERTVAAGIGVGGEGQVQQEREQFLQALHQPDEESVSGGALTSGKADGSPGQTHHFSMTYTPRPPSPVNSVSAAVGGRGGTELEEDRTVPPVGPDNPHKRFLY